MDNLCSSRLTFLGEWYQEEASIAREFLIYYFPTDSTIEIFDLKARKTFLKRTRIDHLSETDFFIGAKINIFGRQIRILDFHDTVTKKKLTHLRERSFILIKPEALEHLPAIIKILSERGFRFNNGRMVQFQGTDPFHVFNNDQNSEKSLYLNSMMVGPVFGLEVLADNAVEKLKAVAGAEDPDTARKQKSGSLRELFGINSIRNGVHVSASDDDAQSESAKFFNRDVPFRTTEVMHNSTLALIKPHVLKSGSLGAVLIEIVRNGFKITAAKMVTLERPQCEEFYEVYKGVLPEFAQMVSQLSSGLCMAVELVAADGKTGTHSEFRKLCGPMDPSIASVIRPNTLRSKFGVSKIMNAVHCTDLPEDSALEVEYFFKIIE